MKMIALLFCLLFYVITSFAQNVDSVLFSTDSKYAFVHIEDSIFGIYEPGTNNVMECTNCSKGLLTTTECPNNDAAIFIGTSRSLTTINYFNGFRLSVKSQDISDQLEITIDTVTHYDKMIPNTNGPDVNSTYYELLIKFNYKSKTLHETGIVTNHFTFEELMGQLKTFRLYQAKDRKELLLKGKFTYSLMVEDKEIISRLQDIVVFKP